MIRFHFILSLLLINILLLNNVYCDDEEEEEMCPCVLFSVTEDAAPCSDFENKDYKLTLKFAVQEGQEEDELDMMEMNGDFDFAKECTDDMEIAIQADLETSNGPERSFYGASNLCSSLKDNNTAWYPLLECLNMTKCPIPANVYLIEGLKMKLDFLDGIITQDFIGIYTLKLIISKAIDTLFCIALGAEIYEVSKPCSECPNANRRRR